MENEAQNKKPVHRNYIIASNLIFVLAAWDFIDYFLLNTKLRDEKQYITIIGVTLISIILGLRIRRGDYWVKYVLAFIVIMMVAAYILALLTLGLSFIKQSIPNEIDRDMQMLIMIWILVLLFRVSKELEEETVEQQL